MDVEKEQQEELENEADNKDYAIFRDSSTNQDQDQAWELQRDEVSDIPRMRSQHSTAGYRDGIAHAKSQSVQEGFDEGYPIGARLGMEVGCILGVLEGLVSSFSASGTAGTTAGHHSSSRTIYSPSSSSAEVRITSRSPANIQSVGSVESVEIHRESGVGEEEEVAASKGIATDQEKQAFDGKLLNQRDEKKRFTELLQQAREELRVHALVSEYEDIMRRREDEEQENDGQKNAKDKEDSHDRRRDADERDDSQIGQGESDNEDEKEKGALWIELIPATPHPTVQKWQEIIKSEMRRLGVVELDFGFT